MADKSNFTPDEWKLLLESVMMASIAITAELNRQQLMGANSQQTMTPAPTAR